METREAITLDGRAQRRLFVLNHVLAGELTAAEAATFLRPIGADDPPAAGPLPGRRGSGQPGPRQPRPRARQPDRRRQPGRGLLVSRRPAMPTSTGPTWPDLLAEREGLATPRAKSPAGPRRSRPASGPPPPAGVIEPAASGCAKPDCSCRSMAAGTTGWRGRGPWLTLVGGIDDATGIVTGGSSGSRRIRSATSRSWAQTARDHGLPLALYSDRHGIFWKNRGPSPPSPSSSPAVAARPSSGGRSRPPRSPGSPPDAPGQGPRRAAVGHGRTDCAVELRLAGAATREEANAVLADYLPRHNARFGVPPADPAAGVAPLPAGRRGGDLLLRQLRRLASDGTFTLAGQSLRVADRPGRQPPRGVVGSSGVSTARLGRDRRSVPARHPGTGATGRPRRTPEPRRPHGGPRPEPPLAPLSCGPPPVTKSLAA